MIVAHRGNHLKRSIFEFFLKWTGYKRFYNKQHCSTYRKRAEEKRKNAFNDDADEESNSDEEISNSLM
jgi:hypothetical protein